jgi:AcrR family transcriptional regulator
MSSNIQQRRHTEIINAAIASLAKGGYLTTSFAEIGRRVGVSKSVVAYHFGKKETLIDAVVNAIYDKGFEVVRPHIDAQTTATGQVEAFIRQSVQFYQEYSSYVVALSRLRLHLTNAGKPNHAAVNRLHKELADVALLFQHGQAQGEFRNFDTAIMARTLRQALDGILIEMANHPHIDTSHYADELVTLFQHATLKNKEEL